MVTSSYRQTGGEIQKLHIKSTHFQNKTPGADSQSYITSKQTKVKRFNCVAYLLWLKHKNQRQMTKTAKYEQIKLTGLAKCFCSETWGLEDRMEPRRSQNATQLRKTVMDMALTVQWIKCVMWPMFLCVRGWWQCPGVCLCFWTPYCVLWDHWPVSQHRYHS